MIGRRWPNVIGSLVFMAAVTVSFALGGAGCFNPRVESGGLTCAPMGKLCPDGFECGAGNRCIKTGQMGPVGTGGNAGGGGTGGGDGTGGSSGTGGSGTPGQVGETCLIRNEGQPDQSDTCDAGLLCMIDCTGGRCYKTCDTDGECLQSSCTRVAPDGIVNLCELPFTTCDARQPGAGGCNDGPGRGCVLVSPLARPAGGERTVCDCQTGGKGRGEPCNVTRDCFRGLVCPDRGTLGGGFCQVICDQAEGCTSGACRPYGAKWGYCF